MRKTTEISFNDSPILGCTHHAPPLEWLLDQENQMNRETPSYLDNLLDSELPFDSKFPLDSQDPSDLDDLEDLLDLRVSDLGWEDDQPQFHFRS